MSNEVEVYYQNIETSTQFDEISKQFTPLTAKMARDLTNITIISKVNENVLPKVEEQAKKGYTIYKFRVDIDIEYNIAIEYLKNLGYKVTFSRPNSNQLEVTLKW